MLNKKVIDVKCGYYHSLCVSKEGYLYSWGYGCGGRLGQGYEEEKRINLNTFTPKRVEQGIEDTQVMSIGCGKQMNCLVVKSGTIYSWGKGEHEKPKFDDYKEYSTPFPMLEDKHISYVSCGVSHVMCLDQNGRLYGWGDGKGGCLGLGDSKNRLSVCPISFFEDKRCIDVSCGDRFTIVIAEVYHNSRPSSQASNTIDL